MKFFLRLKAISISFNWLVYILIFYVLTRLILNIIGVEFIVQYKFMIFHSLDLLKENFLESVFYTHSFTAFMNIIAGIALKLPDSFQLPFYYLISYTSSIILVISFGKILEFFNVNRLFIFVILSFFCCIPPFIYFEYFFFYTNISCSLLTLSIAILIKAFQKNTFKLWVMFFSVCALLSFVRTSYHILWLFATLIIVVIIDFKYVKRKVGSFAIPCSFIFLWYLKNLVLFGFFGASSMFGLNLALVTTKKLSNKEKRALVNSGQMNKVSLVNIFYGIESYKNFIDYDIEKKTGIAVLDGRAKVQGSTNFNHLGFIEVCEKRMQDNLTYLKLYPDRYLKTVFKENIKDFLRPTTKWHPSDQPRYAAKKSSSPHLPNRKILGKWEEFHNKLVHHLFLKPIGFYSISFIAFIYFMCLILVKFIKNRILSIQNKVMLIVVFNIFYLSVISCLFSATELERYRFIIEPLLWLVTICLFVLLWQRLLQLLSKN